MAQPAGVGDHHGDVMGGGAFVVERGAGLHPHLVAHHLKLARRIGGQRIREALARVWVDRAEGGHDRAGRRVFRHRSARHRDAGRWCGRRLAWSVVVAQRLIATDTIGEGVAGDLAGIALMRILQIRALLVCALLRRNRVARPL